jgi:Leucine-rich repeat (LRR) protein
VRLNIFNVITHVITYDNYKINHINTHVYFLLFYTQINDYLNFEMNTLTKSLEDLKIILRSPRLHLENFFIDLIAEVDLAFNKKLENEKEGLDITKQEWLLIIGIIKIFREKCFKKISHNNFNRKFSIMFEEKVQMIEKQLEDSNDVSNFMKIGTKIEVIQDEIKEILFSNQTIVFLNNFYGNLDKPLLVIVENEYLKSLEQFKSKLDLEKRDENIFSEKFPPDSRYWNNDNLVKIVHYSSLRKLDQSLLAELKNLEQFRYTTSYADAFHGLKTLGIRNSLGVFKLINTDTYKNKDLANKNIKDISLKSLDGLSQLKELNLAENEFKLIENFAFKKLENLTNLCLQNNRISQISENMLKGLVSLKELNISSNQIQLIENNSFLYLSKLEKLNLSNNNISQINENMLKGLFNLIDLDLKNNSIQLIENNSFLDLSKLEKLNLSNNQVFQISENTLKGLLSVKELDIASNSIHLIENNSFLDLFFLEKLDLAKHQLTQIEAKTFNGLCSLKKLDLTGNKIGIIEDNSFSSLNNLTYLDLKMNNLVKINQNTFNGLKKLEKLNLRDNKYLSSIDDFSFQDLNELSYLDFWGDSINHINLNTFNGLNNLTKLDLAFNQVNSIDDKTFSCLESCKFLDLRGNYLIKINRFTFGGLSNIEEINLFGNKIEDIEELSFDNLKNLENLYLSSNPITSGDGKNFKNNIGFVNLT